MPTYPYRKPGEPGEPIQLTINGTVARRIRDLYAAANIGDGSKTSVEKYCIEIIESFLSDRRSGIVPREQNQFWNRTDDGYMWEA